jgi:hypothetical protein
MYTNVTNYICIWLIFIPGIFVGCGSAAKLGLGFPLEAAHIVLLQCTSLAFNPHDFKDIDILVEISEFPG